MDEAQETQSSNKIDNERNLEKESENQEDFHGCKKEDYKCSSELDEHDSKQVRFEENGENSSATGEEHSSTENNVPQTNGVDHEEDDDDKDTPTPDDETEEQQETPTVELDEENIENEEESPTTDNLDTTEESQRDSFADSDLSEEARPEEEENEKDIIQTLQKESQYDRSSSFSSLSVNIGSTQHDSDSELQISSRASPEGDIGEESFDRLSVDNEQSFEEGERGVDAEELQINEDENEEKDESKEEREGRLVKQAHLDIALSLEAQEELDDNDDDKPVESEEPTSEDDNMATIEDEAMATNEEDTMATAGDDTMATAEDGTEAEAGLEDDNDDDKPAASEESTSEDDPMATAEDENEAVAGLEDKEEEGEDAESEVAEKVPSVFVSFENKEEEKEEETKPQPTTKDDHGDHTKVKELGRIFQEKDPNSKALYPKGPTSEKSPISVRRFREMFEHGEPQLSPAAYVNVPEEEVTSPRPGIVKNLRDLFENPKNFEWKETVTSTAVVN